MACPAATTIAGMAHSAPGVRPESLT